MNRFPNPESRSFTIVFLPAERVAFTGDFFVGSATGGGLAYMGDSFMDEWPTSLERLTQLDDLQQRTVGAGS